MRTTRTVCVCALLCLVCLLLGTGGGTRVGRSPRGAHHRPLTEAQKADQNLQFMLSLYRSAAEPDGRTKQHRKFGSNTVRLLRPAAAAVHHLPTSRDHHFTFSVRYNLDTHPSERLIRASFIHLRSSPSSSGPSPPRSVAPPPRCRARVTSVGSDIPVTMEPHHRWTETDITAHVLRGWSQEEAGGGIGHVRLRAQYRCTEPPARSRRRRQRGPSPPPQLEAPALLLYLEEAREVKDWMGELLGDEGRDILRRIGQWHAPAPRRRRRSKDPDPQDPSLAALKNAPTSASSFATAPAASIISSIPGGEGARRRGGGAPPKNRCKLHSFRLSFDELGWGHYFIAPPVYNPRFCRGDCPRVLHYGYHSPNHAIIQTLISQMGVGDVPPPSCVPYKYMPMSLLVVHKKKVEYRELDDMVAESCTCR